MRRPEGPGRPDLSVLDHATRSMILGALLFVAGSLLVAGFWVWAPAAGLIAAGVTLAVWSLVLFLEVP